MERSHVRRQVGGMVLMLALVAAGCGDDGPAGPASPVVTTSVTVGPGNTFNPSAIRVSPGATVTWTWSENAAHSINFANATITDEPDRSTGTHSAAMPMAPGTYPYQCDFHPGMTGSVQVQ